MVVDEVVVVVVVDEAVDCAVVDEVVVEIDEVVAEIDEVVVSSSDTSGDEDDSTPSPPQATNVTSSAAISKNTVILFIFITPHDSFGARMVSEMRFFATSTLSTQTVTISPCPL